MSKLRARSSREPATQSAESGLSDDRLPQSVYAARRKRILQAMRSTSRDSVLVLHAAPSLVRNGDVEHDFRQCSDFYWLTGFDEPEAIAVLSARTGQYTLFLRPRDPQREIWDGPRVGLDGARARFGVDAAFEIASAARELPGLLADHRRVYAAIGRHPNQDAALLSALARARSRQREPVLMPSELCEPSVLLHEERLRKRREELRLMRTACGITTEAHARAMREAAPGVREYQLDAAMAEVFARRGAARAAYGTIVGSGPNACILHYRSGQRAMQDGELVLIDAGCEYGYYASDVTRTFPVSGRFSAPQAKLYQAVLDAQLAAIDAVKPGATLEQIHERTVEVLVDGLRRLKLLSGSKKQILERKSYRQFYMHRTSHWLGLDVHDVGGYFHERKERTLEPGMVLTIEPGLYIGEADDSVPLEFRGLGVRIEDDLLVTARGFENLTADVPKSVREVEQACLGG